MPHIAIQSLPFEKELDVARVLEELTKDFSRETGIELQHVMATWQFLQPEHYVVAGKAQQRQPLEGHPLLVELLIPDFNPPEIVKMMFFALASSLSRQTGVAESNIFIHCLPARSGRVFDHGIVVSW